jgi:hypothetical protein
VDFGLVRYRLSFRCPQRKNRGLEGPEIEGAMEYRQSEILSVLEKHFSIERDNGFGGS